MNIIMVCCSALQICIASGRPKLDHDFLLQFFGLAHLEVCVIHVKCGCCSVLQCVAVCCSDSMSPTCVLLLPFGILHMIKSCHIRRGHVISK